ncbi:hypothetical protein VYU27_000680 [Nannochloropsis oceanica]
MDALKSCYQTMNGTWHFANEVIEELGRVMGMRQSYKVPYRPQANGQVERANQAVLNIVSNEALIGFYMFYMCLRSRLQHKLQHGHRREPLLLDLRPQSELAHGRHIRHAAINLREHLQLRQSAAAGARGGAQLNEDRRDEACMRSAKCDKPMAFEEGDKVWMYCPRAGDTGLPAPENFQRQLHVEPEEVIPPLDRDAKHKQRYRIPQHE